MLRVRKTADLPIVLLWSPYVSIWIWKKASKKIKTSSSWRFHLIYWKSM